MEKAILLNVNKNTVSVIDLPKTLSGLYNALDIDMIENRHARINGEIYTIVCDEEGLLKDSCRVSVRDFMTGEPMIVGNILVCREDGEDLSGLRHEDINNVLRYIKQVQYVMQDVPRSNMMLGADLI